MDLNKLTQTQYDKLKGLCARSLGTLNKYVELGLIVDIGGGKYKIKVMYRHFYRYSMIYDGKQILSYTRLI